MIPLVDGGIPICQKPRNMNPNMKPLIKDKIYKMEKGGIILSV